MDMMLQETHPGLPALWYYDPQHYQQELKAIWQQQWICIGRETDWPETGSYQLFDLGDQQALVVRAGDGELNAFHNTCRHRGSALCTEAAGKVRAKRLVCPYHAWSYDLKGRLLQTPGRIESDDFDPAQYSLYPVALECWGGFVFLCFNPQPNCSLQDRLGDGAAALGNWPLEGLQLAHREKHGVACNWKIFWENYLECYHCPGIHPALCRLVPVYGQGLLSNDDARAAGREVKGEDGRWLKDEAKTWAEGGSSGLPDIQGLSEEELNRGMTFADVLPGVFVVAHRDFVRSVRVLPLGPESTLLTVDWLLPASSMNAPKEQIESIVAFARQVVSEDARACELNQKGLKSSRHQHGVLMPQEYGVLEFDNWVREQLGTTER
jgi:Rieske 2Fe-2S family protein